MQDASEASSVASLSLDGNDLQCVATGDAKST